MDIHEPKPWQSVRAFLKEYAIIVIGVLTALAAGQVAEELHWRQAVAEARTAIHEEIAFDNGYFQIRVTAADCVRGRLDDIDRALTAAEASGRAEPVPGAALFLSAQISDAQWQAARAAQTLAHFPHGELAMLGRYYDNVATLKTAFLGDEGEDWRWLADLKAGPHRYAPSDLAQLRYRLRSARWHNAAIAGGTRRLLDLGSKLGVKPILRDEAKQRQFCTATGG